MNVNLSKAASKTKLSMGLNPRGTSTKNKKNVFGDNDSESEDDHQGSSSRTAAVNQALRAEQEALRKRAQRAVQDDVYDYDGAYDSFHLQRKKLGETQQDSNRKSRYIGGLMEAAERRKRERDVIYERKVAREQAAEDAQADYRDKEKFVTAGYKRKLQERELWQAEEKRQLREEEANDVTKKTDGAAMASFYGNLNRNVAMGAKGKEDDTMNADNTNADDAAAPTKSDSAAEGKEPNSARQQRTVNFMEGFEKTGKDESKNELETKVEERSDDPETEKRKKREIREQKVKEARERYFQRHGIST